MAYSSEWIPNDLFLEHNGVKIFRVYKNDNHDEPKDTSFGTAWDTGDDDDDCNFFAKALSTYKDPDTRPAYIDSKNDSKAEQKRKSTAWDKYRESGDEEAAIKAAIIAAIDSGELQECIDAAKKRGTHL